MGADSAGGPTPPALADAYRDRPLAFLVSAFEALGRGRAGRGRAGRSRQSVPCGGPVRCKGFCGLARTLLHWMDSRSADCREDSAERQVTLGRAGLPRRVVISWSHRESGFREGSKERRSAILAYRRPDPMHSPTESAAPRPDPRTYPRPRPPDRGWALPQGASPGGHVPRRTATAGRQAVAWERAHLDPDRDDTEAKPEAGSHGARRLFGAVRLHAVGDEQKPCSPDHIEGATLPGRTVGAAGVPCRGSNCAPHAARTLLRRRRPYPAPLHHVRSRGNVYGLRDRTAKQSDSAPVQPSRRQHPEGESEARRAACQSVGTVDRLPLCRTLARARLDRVRVGGPAGGIARASAGVGWKGGARA